LPDDQDAVLEPDEFESRRQPTRTELDQGDSLPDPSIIDGAVADLDGLAIDQLRDGETEDVGVAIQEGLTWIPPIDPPWVPSPEDPEGIEMAAGSGVDALADPYDDSHRSGDASTELDLTDRIREALRADAATSVMTDRLIIVTRGDQAIVRGVVDTIDDGDTIAAVIERVAGINEVIDETELPES
jgi:hypothetical protein